MYARLLIALIALLFVSGCAKPRPVQVVMDIPPIVRAPDLLKKLDLNIPKDVGDIALNDPEDGGLAITTTASAAPSFTLASASPDDAGRALECLTAAVYYEARSQTDDGERAVAQVVLNRVRDRAFPPSVCGVVYQGSNRRTGCQFSFTCDGSMDHPIQPTAWARAQGIASEALSGAVYAPVGSATFYHANYVNPWWAASMKQVTQIGAHIFYQWKGAMERSLAFRQGYSGSESVPDRGTSYLAASGMDQSERPSSGIQQVAGVTIFRAAPAKAVSAPGEPAAKAAVAVSSPGAKSVRISGGVRVHRGVAPGLEDDDPATATLTIPDES
ncbi:cell wall hydrolase [Sphingomonas immobilis]|uniref:Cell wall hydrolase n=1 Tax=Sphingomonas immobilis TaxID=3063997 RepID=A0ABT8ZYS3_9SPHN|nr:cell wall hydrolase [Sphingomonas sp. CA1-15]MDO7842727.1 cell wall hydrolase [Sphingomonas sp. CA1-15]